MFNLLAEPCRLRPTTGHMPATFSLVRGRNCHTIAVCAGVEERGRNGASAARVEKSVGVMRK